MRLKGVVYDVGRAMDALAPSWRPDYSPVLMRRELDIIKVDLHASAVRLAGRDPRTMVEAAEHAASIGLHVWFGPELWNATPGRTLRYITEAAALVEPLYRRFPEQLTFCVGNELTLFMRGIVPGRNHAHRTRAPGLREVVLSEQDMLRTFLARAAASVRRVYSGPVTYCALPFERVDWTHFDAVAVNYYRQIRRDLSDDQYLDTIAQLKATGKPVTISEVGFAACRDGTIQSCSARSTPRHCRCWERAYQESNGSVGRACGRCTSETRAPNPNSSSISSSCSTGRALTARS